MFTEMTKWAKEEKADFIIGETFYYAEEAFAAVPVIYHGYTIIETCKKLEEPMLQRSSYNASLH